MYRIFADDTLIYDSTLDDYKIGKGQITLETDKSGSFVFSLYPDHPYYDSIVQHKTVITVYKSNRIKFRGRVIDAVTDYWNNKACTCEGEMGFLQDSIVRPYSVSGTPAELFATLIAAHNSQVDEFKQFKVGTCTVVDANGYIARSNSSYESTLSNLKSRLLEDATGGHIYITHGDDGQDPIPTIHYLADFTVTATQGIEFGANLRNYTKTVSSAEMATAIIPLGAVQDDGDSDTEDPRLTIADVNDGVDYVYNADAVALYGWIFKVVEWDDVTDPATLKAKAEADLAGTGLNVTLELTAVDLHLFDRSIESYNVCEYIPVSSKPHNFTATLLCNKETLDLLQPANDTIVLGYTYATFTESSARMSATAQSMAGLRTTVASYTAKAVKMSTDLNALTERVVVLEGGGEGDAKLPLAGGTMVGPLILYDDPTEDLEAVPKRYVDNLVLGAIEGSY